MRVLIVDDSVVFRSQIKAALAGINDIEVVGSAANGKIALARLAQMGVDLMTLDLEMPEMNGLDTLKELRRQGFKTRVIVFSSMTQKGAHSALEALRYGAADVVAKPSGGNLSLETAGAAIASQLIPKVLQFRDREMPLNSPLEIRKPQTAPVSSVTERVYKRKSLANFKPKVIVIGASTGGPRALEDIFENLIPDLRVPILIVQHMPPVFTKCLADRLKDITNLEVDEAKQMEVLQPKKIYIAPGDHHMTLLKTKDSVQVRLDQGPQQNMVRPAVDPLFESAAGIYGEDCMAFVLTGMGEDGCRGAKAIKNCGGGVMIQNKESCVVFGMPGAIFQAEAYDKIGDLNEIRKVLKDMAGM